MTLTIGINGKNKRIKNALNIRRNSIALFSFNISLSSLSIILITNNKRKRSPSGNIRNLSTPLLPALKNIKDASIKNNIKIAINNFLREGNENTI